MNKKLNQNIIRAFAWRNNLCVEDGTHMWTWLERLLRKHPSANAVLVWTLFADQFNALIFMNCADTLCGPVLHTYICELYHANTNGFENFSVSGRLGEFASEVWRCTVMALFIFMLMIGADVTLTCCNRRYCNLVMIYYVS